MKLLAFLLVATMVLSRCKSKVSPVLEQKDSLSSSENIKSQIEKVDSLFFKPFFDSISQKMPLTNEQLKKYTKIDSFYYSNRYSEATFIGDTVFSPKTDLMCCVINYDDKRNCFYKFILIFDLNLSKNTDSKKVYSDCDRDESSDYSSIKYEFINDSVFRTIESFIPKYSDTISKNERSNWKINRNGIIELIK